MLSFYAGTVRIPQGEELAKGLACLFFDAISLKKFFFNWRKIYVVLNLPS